jgi:predicted metal-binding membrane protein
MNMMPASDGSLPLMTTMMVAMMLPSLSPALWRYHRALRPTPASGRLRLTMGFALGYVSVWAAVARLLSALDSAIGALEMYQPAISRLAPLATGTIIVAAGALQLTAWKARQLAHCRGAFDAGRATPAMVAAGRHGLCHGMHCVLSCAGPTAALCAVGLMDVRAMAIAMVAITAERIVPAGERVARFTGVIALATGVVALARAI